MGQKIQTKPIYKRWWFWVIILSILWIIGTVNGGKEKDVQEAVKPVEEKEKDEQEQKIDKALESLESEGEKKMDASEVPKYTVVEEGNSDIGNAVRLEYWVVPEDIMAIDEDGIKAISNELVENSKQKQKLNAVLIWFIDDKREVNRGYNIAKAEYSPYGEWGKAVDVESGDYSKHKYVYKIGSPKVNLLPKDNENYPSNKELEIYFYWANIVYDEKSAEGDGAIQKTANHFGLTFEKTDEILMKAVSR